MSKIEVNAIEPQCGTTLTLGASGDTVTLASGASQTGFGRTGTVDWQTSIKTTSFTAVSGEGYFVNTTSGAITMTLPASPSVGDIVSVKDYAQTFNTNNLTVGRNSQPIEGQTFDLVLDTQGVAITLIYGDATKGWQSVNSNEVANLPTFITATGGTITTSGNCKIHTFTGPGTFTVCSVACTAANNQVSYMVVAGGGGGGASHGAGGAAGGFREDKSPVTPYTSSPLEGAGPITVTATAFPITVGGGGAGASSCSGPGTNGNNSVFSTITSTAGGGGGGEPNGDAGNGGSGGGQYASRTKGTGNTPPVSPPQGNPGGNSAHSAPNYGSGGGGGATTAGVNATSSVGGNGGTGATTSISASPTAYAGGGGGATYQGGTAGTGGAGGGGNGTRGGSPGFTGTNGTAGTTNTGGGGGGGERQAPITSGFAGGSGIVIIRYKFQ